MSEMLARQLDTAMQLEFAETDQIEAENKKVLPVDQSADFYQGPDGRMYAVDDWASEVRPTVPGTPLIQINPDRIDTVLDTLMEVYEQNGYPYNMPSVTVPHVPENMPETLKPDTKEHANFLFNVCYYMRGGIKSVDAVKRMSQVYDKHPWLFDNHYLDERIKYDSWDEHENREKLVKEIIGILTDAGLGFQKTVARAWVDNAQRLQERYDGDARNIFAGVDDYETCVERIKNDGKGRGFVGFQYKMASMLAYFLMDEGLVDPFVFPIPIDVHVMRVSIANRMIEFPDEPHGTNLFGDHTTGTLRDIYYDYALRKNVNPLRLCDAVWLLSGALCSQTPGNRTYEPLGRNARKGRSTVLVPEIVDPHSRQQCREYARSCGRCPVQATCEFNIPITPYYVSGALIIRSSKQELPAPPEQGTLF